MSEHPEFDAVQRELREYISSICFDTTCTNCAHTLELLAETEELRELGHIEEAKSQRIRSQQRTLAALRADRTAYRTALEAARAYVDDPGNWSALDGRRRHLLDLLRVESTDSEGNA